MNYCLRLLMPLLGCMCIGCSASTPDSLVRAQNELEAAKDDRFVMKNAPLKLREAEKTVQTANKIWRTEEDTEGTTRVAEQARKQISEARTLAGRNAVADVKHEAAHSELLLKKTQEAAAAKDVAHTATHVASHYKQQAEKATIEKSFLIKELKAKETSDGLKITLDSDVMFEIDKTNLTSGGERAMLPLVSFLRKNKQHSVVIEGHTDNTGDAEYNKSLSARRAEAVKSYLLRSGISNEQIDTRGMGEKFPIASNGSSAGRLQNRRVEIIISQG